MKKVIILTLSLMMMAVSSEQIFAVSPKSAPQQHISSNNHISKAPQYGNNNHHNSRPPQYGNNNNNHNNRPPQYGNNSRPPQNTKPPQYRPPQYGNNNYRPSYNGRPVTVIKRPRPKVVNRLPATRYPIRHNGIDYYRSKSRYYMVVNGRYVWTPPPFGLRVTIIPAIHTIFRFNNINYYSSEGVIYREYGNQYEIIRPQQGMIVPELPMVNVSQVNIDGMICFEYDGILYKQIPTVSGIQYEVIGSLYD